jgi:hypothetical protein
MDTMTPRVPGGQQYLSLSEMLSFATTKIVAEFPDGTASGTGFFFEYFREQGPGRTLPVLVTNRHVIDGAMCCRYDVTAVGANGMPQIGVKYQVPTPPAGFPIEWIFHPDDAVDLAILPTSFGVGFLRSQGLQAYTTTILMEDVASDADLQLLAQLERVAMPCYPIGLRDEVNNQPIFRTGSLATHPSLPFQGRDEFLVDMHVHAGCSGSPLVLLNTGTWSDKWGDTHPGNRFKLLGVLYAGLDAVVGSAPIHIPGQESASPVEVGIGLGACVDARRLLDFAPMLLERANALEKRAGRA